MFALTEYLGQPWYTLCHCVLWTKSGPTPLHSTSSTEDIVFTELAAAHYRSHWGMNWGSGYNLYRGQRLSRMRCEAMSSSCGCKAMTEASTVHWGRAMTEATTVYWGRAMTEASRVHYWLRPEPGSRHTDHGTREGHPSHYCVGRPVNSQSGRHRSRDK